MPRWVNRRPRIAPGSSAGHGVAQLPGRDTEHFRHGHAGQDVEHRVASVESGLKEAFASHLESHAAGRAFQRQGAHIGVLREAEGDDWSGMPVSEPGDPPIVGIQHRGPVRRQRLDQLALGRRHAVQRIEVLHMGVADVGDYPDSRACNPRQETDFAGVVHANFQDGRPQRRPADAE